MVQAHISRLDSLVNIIPHYAKPIHFEAVAVLPVSFTVSLCVATKGTGLLTWGVWRGRSIDGDVGRGTRGFRGTVCSC